MSEMGGHGPESLDYSVHEAWNEATNVYLLVILVSFGLLMYARKNKRKIMRIFTLPPSAGSSSEPNFYDSLQKVRLRQQLEMYSLSRKYEQQSQTESVQLSMEWGPQKKIWRTFIVAGGLLLWKTSLSPDSFSSCSKSSAMFYFLAMMKLFKKCI